MLHNKYFSILEKFLTDYNKEIYGRQLIGNVPLSQKSIAITLAKLEKEGILKSRVNGNIKYFKLNMLNSEIKDVILITEITKKINFLKNYRKLASLFKEDERIIGIFGSYAEGKEDKNSDLDVFILGEKVKEDYKSKGKFFDIKASIKYFTKEQFKNMIKNKNALCREIIEKHIILFSAEKFINIIWRHYYGFN